MHEDLSASPPEKWIFTEQRYSPCCNGDNALGGVDYAFLIDLAEQDNDTARVASLMPRANF